VIYPVERDPTQFFETLATLWRSGRITPDTLRIRFRAPAHDKLILGIAEQPRRVTVRGVPASDPLPRSAWAR
jgi:hypothetical protein